jgi:cytidylate kinase
MVMSHKHPVRTIAIDGPAGAGKSTLGLGLARHLGFLYFDTGVTYRAVALAVLRRGIAPEDEAAVSALAEGLHIEVLPPRPDDDQPYLVHLDGQDVTRALRNPEVDAVVSIVAAFPRVRRAMVAQQRRIASGQQAVVVGRDIGTVVMPDADLKIYLDASLEARAARRHLELTQRNVASCYSDVLEGLRRRDRLDSSRADSPLRPAHDAVILDSTELSAEVTLAQAIALVEARNAALAPHQSAP